MTHENKVVTYWTLGVAGTLVVLVLLAWAVGFMDLTATGASGTSGAY